MFAKKHYFEIKPFPITMISNGRRNQINHIQWLKKNPPSLAIVAARPRASKTHTSLGTRTPDDKSQAAFDSLSFQGGPITWAKKKCYKRGLREWCETWLDVWNQAKLKDEHWLSWFGLIHHTTAPHDNIIEAVNLNFNNLPFCWKYYIMMFSFYK